MFSRKTLPSRYLGGKIERWMENRGFSDDHQTVGNNQTDRRGPRD